MRPINLQDRASVSTSAPRRRRPVRMKTGGKVKGYKNGGCVMGKRGVRETKKL